MMAEQKLKLYNTLTREKEEFEPIAPPFAGMYVCGPTVYGEPHLGHARSAIVFDLLYRYLRHSGYKVRYVRNITDVGHLENDADQGEDKIAKKARLEQVEPMEVAQEYTNSYHAAMHKLNNLPPSVEPRASGHIIEQQELIKAIIEKGFAYEVNGSVYFDVEKYHQKNNYGKLSGRVLEDLLSNTRQLAGQQEKKSNIDFALWKKAAPEHIMHWPSAWSEGFPGWHLECSAMSAKYLGTEFDIHGGGMDLLFPHHECEIAQNTATNGGAGAKYWIHHNMVTIGGQKMGKSLGNFITLREFFSGNHKMLTQSYSPMTIRFFMLQAHYRSTIDFTNEALQASEKGLTRLFEGIASLDKISPQGQQDVLSDEWAQKCYQAMDDDLNAAVLISHLFELIRLINQAKNNKIAFSKKDLQNAGHIMHTFAFQVLGLRPENETANTELTENLIDFLLKLRLDAKTQKNYATADSIRDYMAEMGIEVKDTRDGFEWKLV